MTSLIFARSALVSRITNSTADEVLVKARELISLQRPSDRDYRSVKRWIHGNKPLVADEEEYIHCKEDLVTLRRGRECAGFDGFMEMLLQKTNCRLIRVSYAFLLIWSSITDESPGDSTSFVAG